MKGHNGHHQLAIGTTLASQVPIQVDESEGGAFPMGLKIGVPRARRRPTVGCDGEEEGDQQSVVMERKKETNSRL